MNLVDCIANLFHQESDFGLRQLVILFQIMIQLPTRTNFKNNVDIFIIIKIAIHLDDVRMIEIHLNLEFPDKLFGDFLLEQETLLNHLKRAYKLCTLLPTLAKKYLTRYTRPYFPFPSSFIFSKSFTVIFFLLLPKLNTEELLVDSVFYAV